MSQLFSPSADTILRIVLIGVAAGLILFWPLRSAFENSSYATSVGVYREQPVPFSHKHHVGDIGINCKYCHSSVEQSSFAGYPSSETCMNCHKALWKDTPLLEPVRESLRAGKPLQWQRIYSLPDYVYFDHSIHVAKGVGCESCHGRIDTMPLTSKAKPFFMQDCLECHRAPEKNIRPPENIYDMGWTLGRNGAAIGAELMRRYDIQTKNLTDCVTCHR